MRVRLWFLSSRALLGFLIPAVVMTACTRAPRTSDNAASPASRLTVVIRPLETLLTPGGEVNVTVTIWNGGEQEVIWGSGSSHCRLTLLVLLDGEYLPAGPPRMCTMDLVQHRLAPGEDYTETFRWDGTVLRDGEPQELSPGEYELYGLGGETRSDRVFMRVAAPE